MRESRFFSGKISGILTLSTIALVFLLSVNKTSAQNQNKGKYPALLWEITGNGLSKPSYLYGTMHVSNRLAFHLSDSFFVALKSADIIALETNPQDWLQNMKEMGMFDMTNNMDYMSLLGMGSSNYGDFYSTAFKFDVPDNKELGYILASDPDLVNGLLYRSNDVQGNHEENTYLDLFIFQSARKMNKQVTNLEDFKESEKMVQEAMVPDPDEEEEAQKYYKGMYEDRGNIQEKIEDAYRKGDLDALDSLSRLTYPSKKYEKYMLHLRNEVMVRGMDSIMKKQVLFTGVGAAHLPGEKGVIEMLRKKGYTVRAVNYKVSKKSIKEKEKIDKTVKALSYTTAFAPDSSFRADVPGKLIETSKVGETRYYLCPEMVNGAYFMVARTKTFAAYQGQDQNYVMQRVDSLFFENIPGKIVKNQKITANNGWPGYDITNQTRRGDFQRYKIFVGPQEVFVFKMGGTGEFVKGSDGEKFFNSIAFADNKKSSWTRFSPKNGGFSAELPNTVIYEKPVNKKNTGAAEKLQAYDPATGDFYMAMRAYYNDFTFIEEDTFELNMFLNKFAENNKFDVLERKAGNFGKYPMLSGKLKNKKSGEILYTNFYLRGPHYYMLAAKTKNNNPPDKFFGGFRFEEFKFTGKFKDHYDSTFFFSVNDEFDDVDDNLLSNMMNQGLFNNYYNKKKEKPEFDESYQAVYLEKNYFSPSSNEAINVEYRKYNDYRNEKSSDEYWKKEFEYYEKTNGMFIKNKTRKEENGYIIYDFVLTDTASTRGIKTRIFYKNGVQHVLQANIDTLGSMSHWMDNFYKTFKPKDSAIGKNIFEDKVKVFLDDLSSADSSKKNAAINSANEIEFKKEHLSQLMSAIEKPAFRTMELNVRSYLIQCVGYVKDEKAIPFLVKQYDVYKDTATLQFAVLNALAKMQNLKATTAFLDLLKKETPLTSDEYEAAEIFYPFYDSLEMAKPLFPGILDLTKFDEYKGKIYSLMASMADKKLINGTTYAAQKAVIQNEANYELKRFNANEVSSTKNYETGGDEDGGDYNYENLSDAMQGRYNDLLRESKGSIEGGSSGYFDRNDLENYALILIPFYNEAATKSFFDKLSKTKNDEVQMFLSILMNKNKLPVNDTIWTYFAKNEKKRNTLYSRLDREKMLDKFPAAYKTQENFCRTELYGYDYNDYGSKKGDKEEKDSIVFIAKKLVKNKKGEGYVYFFKRKPAEKKEWRLDYCGLQPTDEKEVKTDCRYTRKGMRLYEDKTIEEQMKEVVDQLNLKGHYRISGGGYDYDYGGY